MMPASAQPPRRTAIFTLLAVVQFALAAALFASGVMLSIHLARVDSTARLGYWPIGVLGLLAFVSAWLHVLCGTGVWKLKRYGWSLLRAWSALILVAVPVGLVGIPLLSYLNSPGVRLMFSERAIEELSPAELHELAATTRSYAPIVTASVILAVIAFFGAAAVVLSTLFPRRSDLSQFSPVRNEPKAIVTVERFAAAQATYAAANGGRFGSPACLAAPARCIPGFTGSIAFEHPSTLAFQKDGYVFQFFSPETIEVAKARRDGVSVERLDKYAFLALPTGRGGVRMFCVDGSGVLRANSARNRPPSVLLGACPDDWTIVRRLTARP
jgi:hypothetical protein